MPHRTVRVVRAAALAPHLEALRRELGVPAAFPAEVLAEAERAAAAAPDLARHEDARDLELVTLDPAGSTDLDQAVHLARADGGGYTVHYAIADVAAIVVPGGAVDVEAHRRGLTLYGPDGRCPLHPEVLSEGAASLLPGVERPACLWRLDLAADGRLLRAGVHRAVVVSRARLAYADVQADLDRGVVDPRLGLLPEVGRLRLERERARGGVSLAAPEQDVVPTDGGYALAYRATLPVEAWNAQISLAAGIGGARLMRAAGVGILRTLDPARAEDLARLRRAAAALGVPWGEGEPYGEVLRRLDAARPRDAAFLDEATTLFRNAGYRTFGVQAADPDDDAGPDPSPHAAIGAEYAHVTAPLRRLADRYALEICLAASAGRAVPGWVLAALPALPAEMAGAGRRAGEYARAGIATVEAALLAGRVGETFRGVVVDARAPRERDVTWRGEVVLADPAVRAPVTGVELPLGKPILVRLAQASVEERTVRFERVA
jgi:exoribonuclease R